MSPASTFDSLLTTLPSTLHNLSSLLASYSIPQPSLSLPRSSSQEFYTHPSLLPLRSTLEGQLEHLLLLIRGPHEHLHSLVGRNWDHGALYAVLRLGALDALAEAREEGMGTGDVARGVRVPVEKVGRLLGLVRCFGVVERGGGKERWALTAVGRQLVDDADFRAWVEFQLFDTRVGSAHLADALTGERNGYGEEGVSGFKQGWGMEMYEFHEKNVAVGERFRMAMRGVGKALDPADVLIGRWFEGRPLCDGKKIAELGGRYGFGTASLVKSRADLTFEVRSDSEEFLQRGLSTVNDDDRQRLAACVVDHLSTAWKESDVQDVSVYLIRNLLWNWSDEDAIKLLRSLLPTLQQNGNARIVVTDGVSPRVNEFPAHVEIAYRRRDITTMTMHNVKQRSQAEWLELFAQVDPGIKVSILISFGVSG
ncbi:hypothetical protein KVT40_001142 [Elsinoe batatas]|uniref:O-methyltransferase C-terminal domain-containing protein n=1 Tax=Elsinoe batatas TaxID=2601811 RepID=A0A8K0LA08_9PEZI|nr:hypothetical protein KVT40_001142 [Elsinoe batatas]